MAAGARCPVLHAEEDQVYPVNAGDPMNGCQIGTNCPILHAEEDQVYPVGFSDAWRAVNSSQRPHEEQSASLCLSVRTAALLQGMRSLSLCRAAN
jgi:hypothetical protein